jgi:hypothetical protein
MSNVPIAGLGRSSREQPRAKDPNSTRAIKTNAEIRPVTVTLSPHHTALALPTPETRCKQAAPLSSLAEAPSVPTGLLKTRSHSHGRSATCQGATFPAPLGGPGGRERVGVAQSAPKRLHVEASGTPRRLDPGTTSQAATRRLLGRSRTSARRRDRHSNHFLGGLGSSKSREDA